MRATVRRSGSWLCASAAGLPRLVAGPVLPPPLLLVPVFLRGDPTVAKRARRRNLRRHHGSDPTSSAGTAGRLGRVVHHRGRRVVAPVIAGRLVRPPHRRIIRVRRHAVDVRGTQEPALSLVLRRHPVVPDALAQSVLSIVGGPPERGPAVGLPVRRHPVVRDLWRGLLCAHARRSDQPGDRRRPTLPQDDRVPRRRDLHPGRPGPRVGALTHAPRYGCLVARRARRILHLAVDRVDGGPRVRARPVRSQRRVPAHAKGRRAGLRLASVRRELGRDDARNPWRRSDRGLSYALDTASGPLLAVLLVVPTAGFLAAPANSLAAQRAALPPELRARRQSEWRRDGRALVGGATVFAGAGAVVAAIVALFALLVAPSPHFTPPHLTQPARPHHSTTPGPSRSGSPSPSLPPSGAPSSAPSPSASASTGTVSPSNRPTSGP